MKLDYAQGIFGEIERTIRKLEDSYGYLQTEVDFNLKSDKERYHGQMAEHVLYELHDALRLLKWVNAPIRVEGRLSKNVEGRYEIGDSGIELTSGDTVDVHEDDKYWHHSAIEHNGQDYYIKALGKETNIEGLEVRIRG